MNPQPPAPSPPIGPTTVAALTAILVGIVIAGLSLAGIVVDDATTQHIGTVVGGVLSLVALALMTWSRTRQATNLADNAVVYGSNGRDDDSESATPYTTSDLDRVERLHRERLERLHRDLMRIEKVVQSVTSSAPRTTPATREDVSDRIRAAYAVGDTGADDDAELRTVTSTAFTRALEAEADDDDHGELPPSEWPAPDGLDPRDHAAGNPGEGGVIGEAR